MYAETLRQSGLGSRVAKYLALVRLSFQDQIAFRQQFLAMVPMIVLQLLLWYFLWKAAYAGAETVATFDLRQIVTYSVLSRVIMAFTAVQVESVVGGGIREGSIGVTLLAPLNYQLRVFSEVFAQMILRAASTAIVSLGIGFAFLGVLAPARPLALLLMVPSALLAMLNVFCFSFLWGLLFMYVESFWALPTIKTFLVNLLSGALIPFAFFPRWLEAIATLLPFASMNAIPVSLYLGRIPADRLPQTLLIQAGWVALFWAGMTFLSRRVFRKLAIMGG